uniref:Protein BREAKING OF ASYMMETRY IN THE STOMATAL LINEAGE-like n=1 Tax=Cicer arietinum TaxID=3827 RepID=A0A3Q7YE14_CICAR|nr:protein BREAKING OF ASYMMETRY IN THE STOMATAL LINEAGE-like [Cicer arietinum]
MQVRKEMSFNKKKEDNRVIKHIHSKKNFSPPCEKCNKKIKEGVQDGKDSISTVLSSDEGYIVFSFREDGAFDIVIDCNAAAKSESFTTVVDGKNQNSRPVIRKLDYGEDAEQVRNHHIEENVSNVNQHDQDYMTTVKEGETKETINLSRNQHLENNRRSYPREEIEDHKLVCIDSRDSHHSEGSRGSFAFPKLGWELIGSPVKMPKSKDLHLKKHKIRFVRFQCCGF